MQRKRYIEPQIVFALQQAEAGTAVAEICRKVAVGKLTNLFGVPQPDANTGGSESDAD